MRIEKMAAKKDPAPKSTEQPNEPRGVGVILYTDDGKVLLQQRDNKPSIKYPGYWVIFGGGVEENETPEQAIRREMVEELGLKLGEIRLISTPTLRLDNALIKQYIYISKLTTTPDKLVLSEGSAFGLFSKEMIEEIKIGFNFREILDSFFAEYHRLTENGQT
jgi:8-oxo-dGTP diphosphatase